MIQISRDAKSINSRKVAPLASLRAQFHILMKRLTKKKKAQATIFHNAACIELRYLPNTNVTYSCIMTPVCLGVWHMQGRLVLQYA